MELSLDISFESRSNVGDLALNQSLNYSAWESFMGVKGSLWNQKIFYYYKNPQLLNPQHFLFTLYLCFSTQVKKKKTDLKIQRDVYYYQVPTKNSLYEHFISLGIFYVVKYLLMKLDLKPIQISYSSVSANLAVLHLTNCHLFLVSLQS